MLNRTFNIRRKKYKKARLSDRSLPVSSTMFNLISQSSVPGIVVYESDICAGHKLVPHQHYSNADTCAECQTLVHHGSGKDIHCCCSQNIVTVVPGALQKLEVTLKKRFSRSDSSLNNKPMSGHTIARTMLKTWATKQRSLFDPTRPLHVTKSAEF
jgi:hypothetical protein